MMKIQLHYKRVLIVTTIVLICLFTLWLIIFGNITIRHGGREETWNDYDDIGFYVETARPIDLTGDEYIDPFESQILYDVHGLKKFRGKVCREKRTFVFIKTMKCATQTVAQIMRRFGYIRELNFVLPRKDNIYFAWPFVMNDDDYRPSNKPFNILVEHSVYNKDIMRKIMPNNTVYITIIREPWSHFRSTFNYFNLAEIARVSGKDKLSEYLQNINIYEPFYKSDEASPTRYCIPNGFSVTKNLLSHCLGMPIGFPHGTKNITSNLNVVKDYINSLDESFLLVMIMEYFHESLVLLKRLMCWSFKDIIYHTENIGNYSKETQSNPENVKFYKHWSKLDYMLYDHFNQSFWKKVNSLGRKDFIREVKEFTKVQDQVTKYCSDIPSVTDNLVVRDNRYTEGFIVTPDFCILLGVDLLPYLRRRYDRVENKTEPEDAPKRTC